MHNTKQGGIHTVFQYLESSACHEKIYKKMCTYLQNKNVITLLFIANLVYV